jgi:outer membrane lipoprotein carrier protein
VRRIAVPSALAASMLSLAPPLAAQDAERALERAVAAYGAVRSLEAAFVQTSSNPMIGGPESSRGVLYLVRPDRFAMRFTSPDGDRIVADGQYLWLYLPSTVPNQVIRTTIPSTGTAGPNLFAQFLDRPTERYRATYLEERRIGGMVHDIVRLEPRESLGFRRADLAIGRSDGLIRMVDLIDASGLARRLDLSALRTNLDVPPAEVSFSAPAGVRVVTQP